MFHNDLHGKMTPLPFILPCQHLSSLKFLMVYVFFPFEIFRMYHLVLIDVFFFHLIGTLVDH